jgi:hypothetical protein
MDWKINYSENPAYEEWIATYLARVGNNGYGKCQAATGEMVAAFPELTIVRGHVEASWGRRSHFWCTAPDGSIVDPTAAQFPALFGYDPWKPGDEIMVGKCMNCGEEIWAAVTTLDEPPARQFHCSDRCLRELEEAFS